MAWSWLKTLRAALKWTLTALAVLLALLFLHQCILPLVAFIFPALDPALFDFGVFGSYPTQKYVTSPLPGPLARQLRWDDDRCGNGLVLLTPNGPAIERPGPMIVDAKGALVWMSDDFGVAANLKVQRYAGQNYLTLWSGEKAATSGKGVYFMIDSTYQVVKMVTAIGEDLFGDLHEFKITDTGTGLLTVYNTTQADLTGMGLARGPNGWIVDNLFQEIDLETGELLFQWRASDHFDPIATFMTNPFGGHWESMPFDWYHINSVDKDSQGNYLISARHFHSVTCISPDGEVLWVLGGRDNEFRDLSDGEATNFKWQHDARWISEDEGILTLFDNSKAGPLHVDALHSRAMFIQLDIPNRTAKLIQSLVSAQGILASSQGSVEVLPESSQTFVGWGSAAAYSEYSQEGELMCETHLAASWFYWMERFKSYRASKSFEWHANPREPPTVKILDDALYVSWNGATEVVYWSLEMCSDADFQDPTELRDVENLKARMSDKSESKFDNMDIIPKTGFEGSFELPAIPMEDRSQTRYRVAALDGSHAVLGYSNIVLHNDGESTHGSIWMTVFKCFLFVGFCVGIRLMLKYYQSRRRANAQRYSVLSPPAWMEWNPPARWSRANRLNFYQWAKSNWTRVVSPPG